jgi:hypothetical protein
MKSMAHGVISQLRNFVPISRDVEVDHVLFVKTKFGMCTTSPCFHQFAIVTLRGVGKSLVVQPVDEEFKDVRFGIFQRNSLLFGFFEMSGESGAEEFGVVDQETLVNKKTLCIGANKDSCKARVLSAAYCELKMNLEM